MRRDELAELLRKASVLAEDGDMLVVGSQSILGTFDEASLPTRATLSQEADIVFLRDPDRRKADLVNAHIGEMSPHQESTGVYAEGLTWRRSFCPPAGGGARSPGIANHRHRDSSSATIFAPRSSHAVL